MRILVGQLNYKIGDFAGNFNKMEAIIRQYAKQVDLIVFSELSLSGYYPKDLITHAGFIELQNNALQKIQALTQECQVAVIVGFVSKNEKKGQPYYNSLALIKENMLYVYHKRLLPVYNIFDEARHFCSGDKPGIYQFQGLNFGFLICEDGWAELDNYLYPCSPVDDLAQHKLDAIICINGSPSNIGKQQERIQHFSAIAKKCQAPVIFTNQIGGNDEIIFDGASFVLDKKGNLLGCLKSFEEDTGLLELHGNQVTLSSFIPYQPLMPAALFYHQTILGLKDYVFKCGFSKVVIGISGGIDSAVTLALAVKALGNKNVIGLAMPSRYSSAESLTYAQAICDSLGVKLYQYSIEAEFSLSLTHFNETFVGSPSSMTEQNIQARLRGRILMEYSNQTGALVLSTGNKSELSVGYTTLYGDMTGGFNLIGDLYKTDVYQLAHYFNQVNPSTPIPLEIIKRIPSAELAPQQKDSDTLPEYHILDPILKLYIEGDLLSANEIKLYQECLQGISPQLIQHIHDLVDAAEFKRRQSAPIVRVQRRAFGHGRQLPIAATYP